MNQTSHPTLNNPPDWSAPYQQPASDTQSPVMGNYAPSSCVAHDTLHIPLIPTASPELNAMCAIERVMGTIMHANALCLIGKKDPAIARIANWFKAKYGEDEII